MSYSHTFDIHLGPLYAGLTLAAQLIDTAGDAVGGEVTTGFVELGGNGDYLWTASIPDGHIGGVLIYEDGALATVLAVGAINGPPAVNVTLWAGDAVGDAPVSAVGNGAISFPVTVNDEDSNPIDGVEVWITTDSGGTNVVAGTLSTDALGVATFMLDAGDYYVWRQASGYNFTNPVAITVS